MNFTRLMAEIEALSDLHNVETRVIGRSVLGRPIYAFHVGSRCTRSQVIITGAIHAREWITALLVAELVKIYSAQGITRGGIWFVPLCNPDGVQIALDVPGRELWKANARGVDLNVNFDVDWGGGTGNVMTAGAENYIGLTPNSEPEVQALINFTTEVNPKITVAYHSKGEVIYYGFQSLDCRVTRRELARVASLARKIGRFTGYVPEKTKNSTGGYSDWVLMHLGVPALTIEVGSDDYPHPIGRDKLPEILAQNKDVPEVLLAEAVRYSRS